MIQTITYHLRDVIPYINWIYFFHAWGFPPRFAGIADIHDCAGCRAGRLNQFPEEEKPRATEAMRLYDDARQMLTKLDATYHSYVRFGLYDANSDGDNLVFWSGEEEQKKEFRLPLLRQQQKKTEGPFLCLSDYVRPIAHGIPDKVGVFCATVDEAIEHLYEKDEDYDPFAHMLCQTLADRLAEASVEKMHEEVRKTYWGYAPDEQLSNK